MMPHFSKRSRANLNTCAAPLAALFERVLPAFDCTIIEGSRSKQRQNELFRLGKTQLIWPESAHNMQPSHAVDVIAYPVDWNDRERQTYFAGHVQGIALLMGLGIRWGGDWDSDTEVKENGFDDLVHFELKGN